MVQQIISGRYITKLVLEAYLNERWRGVRGITIEVTLPF